MRFHGARNFEQDAILKEPEEVAVPQRIRQRPRKYCVAKCRVSVCAIDDAKKKQTYRLSCTR
jgi:hypothetical protein